MEYDVMKSANRLRDLRTGLPGRVSQETIAKELNVTKGNYSKWETGTATNGIPVDAAFQLSEYFHVTLDYLYGLTDDPNPKAAEIAEYTGLSHQAIGKLNEIKRVYGPGYISLISGLILSSKFISVLGDLHLLKYRSDELSSLSPRPPITKDAQEAIHLKRGFSLDRSANDYYGFAEIVTGIDALHYRADKAVRKIRALISDICGIADAENAWEKKCRAEHEAYNKAFDSMKGGADDGK